MKKKDVLLILIANRGGHVVEDKIDEVNSFDGMTTYRVPLTDGIVNIFNIDRLKGSIRQTIEDALTSVIDSEKEEPVNVKIYLLTSGSIVINVLASMVLQDMGLTLNLLIWDTKNHCYVPRENV